MQLEQLVLPALATAALGTALLVPMRDNRRGKRATLSGRTPLRANFLAVTIVEHPRIGDVANPDVRPSTLNDDEAQIHTASAIIEQSDNAQQIDDTRASRNEAGPTLTFREIECPVIYKAAANAEDALHQTATHHEPSNHDTQQVSVFDRVLKLAKRAINIGWPLTHTPTDVESEAHNARTSERRKLHRNGDDELKEETVSDQHENHNACHIGKCSPNFGIGTVPTERSFAHELDTFLSPIPSAPAPSLHDIDSLDRGKSINIAPPARPSHERVVPITRLPLRRETTTITWPGILAADIADGGPQLANNRRARHSLLIELARRREARTKPALLLAYREEDIKGRHLALRALVRFDVDQESREVFLDAMHTGSDDERSVAIDAFQQLGDRTLLIAALDDRVDALAARAALYLIGASDRDTYRRELTSHLESERIETILALLAGFVE